MSTRAEEIAAELYYTQPWENEEDRRLFSELNAIAEREQSAFTNGYKHGQQDRWISVEDRLPEPMVKVLVHQQYDDDAFIAKLCNTRRGKPSKPYWYVPVPDAGYVDGDGYWDGDVDEAVAKITHWMPLPSPPNPEQP